MLKEYIHHLETNDIREINFLLVFLCIIYMGIKLFIATGHPPSKLDIIKQYFKFDG